MDFNRRGKLTFNCLIALPKWILMTYSRVPSAHVNTRSTECATVSSSCGPTASANTIVRKGVIPAKTAVTRIYSGQVVKSPWTWWLEVVHSFLTRAHQTSSLTVGFVFGKIRSTRGWPGPGFFMP